MRLPGPAGLAAAPLATPLEPGGAPSHGLTLPLASSRPGSLTAHIFTSFPLQGFGGELLFSVHSELQVFQFLSHQLINLGGYKTHFR